MIYKIDKFEVDTEQFRITNSGNAVSIEPKVFDLIVYLIKHRQNLISRDELFAQIWSGREVSDTTLSNHIKSARKVFGDNGELQNVIKTVRGRGYQFVAPVEEYDAVVTHDPDSKSQRTLAFSWNRVLPLIVLFPLLIYAAWLNWQDIASKSSSQKKPELVEINNQQTPNSESQKLDLLPSSNLAAYELFVAGQLQVSHLDHQSLLRSIELFDQAIELDPQFEAAYVAKANAYRLIMSYFERPVEVLPKVVSAVLDALKVNPQSAQALSSLGLAYVFAWRWQDAWKMLNAAKSIDPNIAQTELGFALYYSGIGDKEGVVRSLTLARELDPLNVEIADWGNWALMMVGEQEAAITWSKDKLRLHPKVGMIYSGASVTASLSKQHSRAISLAQNGVQLDPESPYAYLALAQAYGFANQVDKIPALLEKAEKLNSYVCPYESAVNYILLEDYERAFAHLNDAVESRSNCLVFTRNDLRLTPIRQDPRFSALLIRIGLDDASIAKYAR
ncbi:winged helix-turn-helix domain-containing protein [Aliiglaciecola lipolytica]|uniref:Transcriptional activator of cad operon n=1 Tax=Aliiglaciecola lipolytica E3 TaxID=1127673 RepID=K6YZ68_9ALTE|nr:winged helix-turn-helix domain-containing protein [Aliiglaciecola lipolytica]GAC16505.1 transcriptional activator of cad operon [Aliiglaciecola lipolytica E3]